MKCKYCGNELPANAKFCSQCGQKYVPEPEPKPVEPAPKVQTQSKCWKVFSTLGFVFGIIAIVTCWIPLFNAVAINLSVPGIVFSALGKSKVQDEESQGKASKGLVLCIVGLVIAIVIYIVWAILAYVLQVLPIFLKFSA